MLKRLGIENRLQGVIFFALSAVVIITPLGKEASNPIVLGLYRTLLFLIIMGAFRASVHEQKSRISGYFLIPVITFVFLMAVSLMLEAGSHVEGRYVFYEHVLFLAAFIALAHFQRTQSDAWKRNALIVVVGADIGFMVVAFLMPTRPILGPFVNPNYFASFLLPGIGICLAYAMFGMNPRGRIAALVAATALYFGIIQASSRGATLAAIAMISVGIFRVARQRGVRTGRLLLVGIVVGVVTIAVSPALIQKFLDRGERDPYNYQRPQIWLGTLKMIADNPVFGVGPGRYYYTSKLYTPAVEGTIARYRKWPNIAHSEYLQYVAESGIPAGLLMFAIGGFLFVRLWRRAEHLTGQRRVFQESALLAAVGLGAHALVDNNWTAPIIAAAMAVISQADVLPVQENSALQTRRRGPAAQALLATACAAIFIQSTLIPTIALYFNEVGHQAYVAGRFDRAELMHEIAVGIAPNHAVLLDNLGMVYLDEFIKTRRADYLEQAETAFQASMAANPHFDIAGGHLETTLIQHLTGNAASDLPIHHKIVAADRYVLAANPYNPFIRRNLAEALYNTGDRAEAAAELERAIAIEPNYVPGYLRLAEWTAEAGHEADSGEYRRKAIELVTKYQDRAPEDFFEALLLGRPTPAGEQQ